MGHKLKHYRGYAKMGLVDIFATSLATAKKKRKGVVGLTEIGEFNDKTRLVRSIDYNTEEINQWDYWTTLKVNNRTNTLSFLIIINFNRIVSCRKFTFSSISFRYSLFHKK